MPNKCECEDETAVQRLIDEVVRVILYANYCNLIANILQIYLLHDVFCTQIANIYLQKPTVNGNLISACPVQDLGLKVQNRRSCSLDQYYLIRQAQRGQH